MNSPQIVSNRETVKSESRTLEDILSQRISQDTVGEIIGALEATPFSDPDARRLRIVLVGILRSLFSAREDDTALGLIDEALSGVENFVASRGPRRA
jgi:hypothetical protein